MTIASRLIIGFSVVIAIATAVELYAVSGVSHVSRLTIEMYDHPLMSSNFARRAP